MLIGTLQVLDDYDKHTEGNPKYHFYEAVGEKAIEELGNEEVQLTRNLECFVQDYTIIVEVAST